MFITYCFFVSCRSDKKFQDLLIQLIRKKDQEETYQDHRSDAYIRLLQTWQTTRNRGSQD